MTQDKRIRYKRKEESKKEKKEKLERDRPEQAPRVVFNYFSAENISSRDKEPLSINR
jgi:hypothetical protein